MNRTGTDRTPIHLVVVAGLCMTLAACSSQPKETGAKPTATAPAVSPATSPAAAQAQPGEPKRFDLSGKVVSIDKPGKQVMVDAEDIPGFMSAMTMAYPVKDEHLLDQLAPGVKVTAKVVKSGSDYWLEDITTAK